jgi:hypothetical protein
VVRSCYRHGSTSGAVLHVPCVRAWLQKLHMSGDKHMLCVATRPCK